MIDYDKLKQAHELAEKLKGSFRDIRIDYCLRIGCDGTKYSYCYMCNDDFNGMKHEFESDSIEELIAKLRGLTEPKQDYKLGWYLTDSNMIESVKCVAVGDGYAAHYEAKNLAEAFGKKLFPTKEVLIEAQIVYWKSLHDALQHDLVKLKANECQHESDGKVYLTHPVKYKCIKCGEFYR